MLRALEQHRGKGAAVLGRDMAQVTGIEYNKLRAVIAHLVNDHGVLIVSCGRGYYIPVTPEEIVEATRSLRHRGIAILVRAAALQKTSVEEIFRQSRIEFEGARQ